MKNDIITFLRYNDKKYVRNLSALDFGNTLINSVSDVGRTPQPDSEIFWQEWKQH